MESMRSSITPAPRGNTASPSHGGDTTFRRGESPAGVASSLETCSAQGRLTVVASQAAGGKEIALLKTFLFFFGTAHRHLACSQKQQKVTGVSVALL